MTLEQAIKKAVGDDRLDGLTLYPSGSRWQANARFAGSSGWVCVSHADPVQALLGALGTPTLVVSDLSHGVFD